MALDFTHFPLSEFDPDKKAIIDPAELVNGKSPSEYCVMTFFGGVLRKLLDESRLEIIKGLLLPEPTVYPRDAYQLEYKGKIVVVVHPGIGAALAAGNLDQMIALGCRKFVACGSAGVLKSTLKRGSVVIPEAAVRDEGTSYHYYPPSRVIEMDRSVVNKLEAILVKHSINYEIGKAWTTDGFFWETKSKVTQRAEEGCIVVDMECSALIAVASFRNVVFGQYLAAGDDVSGEQWDLRYVDDAHTYYEKVF